MLVSVGRGAARRGHRARGGGRRSSTGATGIATDDHRRTSVPHIYAVGDCAGYWQLAHTAFREGEVAAENACGHDAVVDNRAVPRPIYTDPEIAGVGLTEAQAREQYGDDVAVGDVPVGRERARGDAGATPSAGSSRSTRRGTASCSAWSWSARTSPT